jgi:DNA replication and repair protein RecF
MSLGRLGIVNIRNIRKAELTLNPGINLFVGPNGSGKTSLLEAAYFLGSGRTFRSNSIDPLISRGEKNCTVFGSLESSSVGRMSLGVERSRDGHRKIRVNGEDIKRSSELAKQLPTLVLGPNTVELLTDSPGVRRRFLNWGVFHVEHAFSAVWEQGTRCLRQRNEALRSPVVDRTALGAWNEQLGRLADQIHGQRKRYFDALESCFIGVASDLAGIDGVKCTYRKGWDGEDGLVPVLQRLTDSDIQRGYTQSGYHRADIRVTVNNDAAASVCSRGELKILAWALVLSQGRVFREATGRNLLYLVDDLSSELDGKHRQRVCDYLAESDSQVLVTAIDRGQFGDIWGDVGASVFHVEHGHFGDPV